MSDAIAKLRALHATYTGPGCWVCGLCGGVMPQKGQPHPREAIDALPALLDLADEVSRVRRRYAYARDGEVPISGLDGVWCALARLSGDTGDGGER